MNNIAARSPAPVVVFAYKRADRLSSMIDSLAACDMFTDSRVTIYVDGPKSPSDSLEVEKVQKLVLGLKYKNVHYVFREKNIGLRTSIYMGVTEQCAKYGRVIVLEDDLELSRETLRYFNLSLDRYSDESRVWSVCAYMYDVPELRGRRDAFFLPFTHPWGWATWQRAWTHFSGELTVDRSIIQSRAFRDRFSVHGIADFASMLQLALDGYIDSWFIRWYYCMFEAGALGLFPPRPLVRNSGIGGPGATHGGRLNPYSLIMTPAEMMLEAPNLPDLITADLAAIDVIAASRDAKVQRIIQLLGRHKRRLKTEIQKAISQ